MVLLRGFEASRSLELIILKCVTLITVGDIGFEWPKAECSHEAYELIKHYTSNQDQLQELRVKNISWWNSYKKYLQEEIKEVYKVFAK